MRTIKLFTAAAFTVAVVATASLTAPPASAQECGPCASKTSVNACVACVKATQPGKWTQSQMEGWCGRNIAQCKKK